MANYVGIVRVFNGRTSSGKLEVRLHRGATRTVGFHGLKLPDGAYSFIQKLMCVGNRAVLPSP